MEHRLFRQLLIGGAVTLAMMAGATFVNADGLLFFGATGALIVNNKDNNLQEFGVSVTNIVGKRVVLISNTNTTLNPTPTATVDNITGAAADLATGKFFCSTYNIATFTTAIYAGSLASPGTVSTLLTHLDAAYLTGINSITLDAVSHTLYYSYFDATATTAIQAAGNTTNGIYSMPETGGPPVQVVSIPALFDATQGFTVSNPDQIALDLNENLIFFTDDLFISAGVTFSRLWVGNVLSHAATALVINNTGLNMIKGIAYNRNTHTLYYSYFNGQTPSQNQLLAATVTVAGSGSLTAATLSNSRVLYSGASAPALAALAVDPATGLVFGAGEWANGAGNGVWVGQTNPAPNTSMTAVTTNSTANAVSSLYFASSPVLPNIVSVTQSNSDIVTGFNAIYQQTYRLQLKTNLVSGSWASISGVADLTVSTNGVAHFTHTNALNLGTAFYRVGLLP